jgi:hypothetical protein
MKKEAVFFVILLCLAVGCAIDQQGLNPDEISDKFETIGELNRQLAVAEEDGIDIFAPGGFLEARRLYTEAYQMAGHGKTDEPVQLAEKGLSVLSQAKSDAGRTQETMWEVIDVRQRARNAGAPELFSDRYEAAEKTCRGKPPDRRGRHCQGKESSTFVDQFLQSNGNRCLKRGGCKSGEGIASTSDG